MRSPATDKPISEAEAARLFAGLDAVRGVALAVSGGPDSTALLWLAALSFKDLEKPPKLIALTVDHGLRKESAREAKDVARLCETLGVEHRTLRWTGKKPRTGIQEAARNARYRLLAQATHEAGLMHLVTAHTLDDQAETVLFRMARGSGVAGLAGMGAFDRVPVADAPPTHLVRPLLTVPKARLVATLDAAGISYAVDPSNADPRFARPRFRALMPLLATEGLAAERLGKLASRAERVEEALLSILDDVQRQLCPNLKPKAPATVTAEAFVDLPDEIGLRLLRRMIAVVGNEGDPELGQLEVLHEELKGKGVDISLGRPSAPLRRTLAGALVTLSGDKLTVEPAPPRRNTPPKG